MPSLRPLPVTSTSAAERLDRALATLTAPGSSSAGRVTVSALCELANVSRNSLYRYHPTVLRDLRQYQRRCSASASVPARCDAQAMQAELIELRQQVAKLVALVDHFYAAYQETHALLGRREQELAELRRRLDSKPAQLGR